MPTDEEQRRMVTRRSGMAFPISPIVDCTAPIAKERLSGKSVLVTGGASGIGAGIVKEFAEAGAHVTFADIDSTLGDTLRDDLRCRGLHANFIRTDVTKWDELVAAFVAAVQFAPHKALDIVCPNAGIIGPQLVSEWPGEKARGTPPPAAPAAPPPRPDLKNLEVNLLAVMYSVQLAVHYFRLPSSAAPRRGERADKAVILTGSIMSYLDCPSADLYGVGKMGVRGLFKALRGAALPPGVRVCMVAPTYIHTPLTDPVLSHLTAAGVKFAPLSSAISAFLRLASDPAIHGRCLLVGPDRVVDVRDDFEGLDGALEMRAFVRDGSIGAERARIAWGEGGSVRSRM
ncbi:MAG: hypothetical protein M1840_005188 [Geoglossum simile]|nr:MAG: hypothetical protein M1840_005188 [Geoglossum simile]